MFEAAGAAGAGCEDIVVTAADVGHLRFRNRPVVERRGSDANVRGIAFFFGIAFIIEVLIILQFGVDQRSVTASYIGKAWRIGDMASLPSSARTSCWPMSTSASNITFTFRRCAT